MVDPSERNLQADLLDHVCNCPREERDLDVRAVPPEIELLPDWDDRSKILTGTDGKAIFGDGDMLTIERGIVDGVYGGQRFSIWRDFHNRMPLFYIGDIVIMEPGQRTSKAVVIKAVDAIMITSDVAIPRRPKQQ